MPDARRYNLSAADQRSPATRSISAMRSGRIIPPVSTASAGRELQVLQEETEIKESIACFRNILFRQIGFFRSLFPPFSPVSIARTTFDFSDPQWTNLPARSLTLA